MAFFTVGRQNWLKFVEEDLDFFIANGGGKVRFINGDYGDGKTHFMSVIQQLALQKNFASSFVVLTLTAMLCKSKRLSPEENSLRKHRDYRPREYGYWLEKTLMGYNVASQELTLSYESG